MFFDFFLKGLIIGFSIAAPVGAIGTLCIRRSLIKGRRSGFFTGLGAATADALYGAIAAFGLTTVTNTLLRIQSPLRSIGALFLFYLGFKTWRSKPQLEERVTQGNKNLVKDYLSTLGLTLTNPSTIFSFLAVFAGVDIRVPHENLTPAASLSLGIFFGSAIWWFILSGSVSLFRNRITPFVLEGINKIAAVLIASFGALALASFIKTVF